MLCFPAASDEQLYYNCQGQLHFVVLTKEQVCDVP